MVTEAESLARHGWGRQAKTWEFADGLTAVLQAPGPASPPAGRAGKKREPCGATKNRREVAV
jgi:hypothetical protein